MLKPPFNQNPSVLAISAMAWLLVSNQAMAVSTIISGSVAGISNVTSYDLVSISNSGTISGNAYGVNNQGSIGTLTNNGNISASFYGIYGYYGSIGALTNYGSISGGEVGIYNDSGSTITGLTNHGSISGAESGIYNYNATIGQLTNSGIITSGSTGIQNNTATINTLINSGTISASSYGIYNDVNSTINSLSNSGSIGASSAGIYNYATTISALTNSGTISANNGIANVGGSIGQLNNLAGGVIVGGESGIYNSGSISTIGSLINSGTISAEEDGITNSGRINTLSNSGLILGYVGIDNSSGNISALINSGNIKGYSYAINNNGGGIGYIANSGTILGNIYSTSGLTIAGGSGSAVGALSGYTNNNSNLTGSIGSIQITNGDLVFSSGNLILNDNVTLSTGSLNNSGATLYIANPITINGNYTQSASASLNSYVFSENVYGRLAVTGSANIASGSSVKLIGYQYGFAAGQRYVVISAASGDYNASSLNYSASGYTGSITGASVVNGANTDLVLTLVGDTSVVTPTQPTQPSIPQATTPNAIASLGGLQRYSGTSNAALLNLYNASLAIGSTAEANKAGEQLSPSQNASAGSASSAATFDMLNVISGHLTNGTAQQIAQANGGSGISAGNALPQQASWGQVFGGHASQDRTSDVSGYNANYAGAVVGYDRAISDDWRLGGAFSYTNTRVHGTDNVGGSNTEVTSYALTAYASYIAPKWYSNLYATAADQRYNSQRQISFTGYDGRANGKFNGQQYALKAEFGYPIALSSNATLTPLADISYSRLQQNGYTESGGNGAALQVDSTHSNAIKSGLGAKLETIVPSRWGDVISYVQLLWNHQYNRSRMAVTAAYAADVSETSFTSLGSSPAKDAADLTLGATLLRSRNTSLSAYYKLNISPNYTNQSLSLRIKQLF